MDKLNKSYIRPTLGWVGVVGVAYHFIIQPLAIIILAIWGITVTPAPLSDGALWALFAVNGVNTAARSYDKKNGTHQ